MKISWHPEISSVTGDKLMISKYMDNIIIVMYVFMNDDKLEWNGNYNSG